MQRIDKLRLTVAGISLGFPARDPPRPRPRPRQGKAKQTATSQNTMQEIIPSHYFPTAPTFDGIGDKLDMPYSRELNPTSFTVEMWVMVEGGSNYQSILASVGGSSLEGRRGYLFCVTPGMQWQFWLGTGEPKAFWRVISGPRVALNVWRHLSGTYNQESGIMTFHVNGQEVGRQIDVQYLPNDRNPTRVGAGAIEQLGASPCFFRGKVAEVHVWDRVLSSREIQGLATQEAIEVQAEAIAEIATETDEKEANGDFDPAPVVPDEKSPDNSNWHEKEPDENETDYNQQVIDPWEEGEEALAGGEREQASKREKLSVSGSGEGETTDTTGEEKPIAKKPQTSVESVLWQIGSPGKAGTAAPTGPWAMVYDYTIGTDPHQIDRPTVPTCLVPLNANNKIPNSTSLLNVHFFLPQDYAEGQLVLCYDRYGSGEDNVFLDGQLIARSPGAEGGKLKQSQIPLGAAAKGFHKISMTNAHSSDSAHLIDYIQLKFMLSNITSQLANLSGGNLPQNNLNPPPGNIGGFPGVVGLGNTPTNPIGQPTNATSNPTDIFGNFAQFLSNLPCQATGTPGQEPGGLLGELAENLPVAGQLVNSLLSNVTAQLASLVDAIQSPNNPNFQQAAANAAGLSATSGGGFGNTAPGIPGQGTGTSMDPTVLLSSIGQPGGLGGLGNVVGGLGDAVSGVAGQATGGGGNPADLLGNATEAIGDVAGGVTDAVGGIAGTVGGVAGAAGGVAGQLAGVGQILAQGTQLIGQVEGLMGQVNTFMGQLTNLMNILVPLIQQTQNMVASTLPALPFSPFSGGSNQSQAVAQQNAEVAQMLTQINQMSQVLNQLTQMLNQQAQVGGILPGQPLGQLPGMAGGLNPTQLAQLQQLQAAQQQLQGFAGQGAGIASGLNPTQVAQLQAAQQQLRGMGAQTGMSQLPPELLAQLQQQQQR